MLKQILFLILIAFALASCSTTKHISQQNINTHINKKAEEEKVEIKAKGTIEVQKTKKKTSIKHKLETHYNKYKAVPYKYGGTSIKGFDCSGFVQFTYKSIFNIHLPRTTRLMLKEGIPVSKNKLKIGDLVLFRTSKRYRHVGIFIGEDLFIHISTKKGLMKSSLKNPYWSKHYLTSRRIF